MGTGPAIAKILLLGSGELGREFVVSAKRLGAHVVACDSYARAPAMQFADECEVFPMLDGAALSAAIDKHKPDFIVPEIEAIRTEVLKDYEERGYNVVPSARAAMMTLNRDGIRDVAANELHLPTSAFRYAETLEQMREAVAAIGIPCVVKPVMSSSGKGQSTVSAPGDIDKAWQYAVAGMRGDRTRVIVEAQAQAKAVVDNLGGYGIFGVEFFVKGDEVIFSELSPRPHDTGMVTLISQNLTEFDLHARAVLGLPIPSITQHGPSASAVILADRDAASFGFEGLADALTPETDGIDVDVRIFNKPVTRPYRRMGVALALAKHGDTDAARAAARDAAAKVRIVYRE